MVLSRTLACGTCRATIQEGDAVGIAPGEMRELARKGFGEAVPLLNDQPPAQRRDLFRQFADSYTTQWKVCPACAALIAAYRAQDTDVPVAHPPVSPPKPDNEPAPRRLLLSAASFSGRMVRTVVASNWGIVAILVVLALAGSALWNAAARNQEAAHWWWQSHSALSAADAKARAKDWLAAREILQRALAENPGNPPLLRRMANAQMLSGRPDLAALYYRAFATTPGVDAAASARAHLMADRIAQGLRAHARAVYQEVYRLHATLPAKMRQADGPPFHPLEALSVPPVVVSAQLAPSYTIGGLDGMQVTCVGIAPRTEAECVWSFRAMPWVDILNRRRIAIDYPPSEGRPRCCELALDDPDLTDPSAALRRIGQMPPAHQLRAMFGLASKLAFVANTIAFNARRRPGAGVNR